MAARLPNSLAGDVSLEVGLDGRYGFNDHEGEPLGIEEEVDESLGVFSKLMPSASRSVDLIVTLPVQLRVI